MYQREKTDAHKANILWIAYFHVFFVLFGSSTIIIFKREQTWLSVTATPFWALRIHKLPLKCLLHYIVGLIIADYFSNWRVSRCDRIKSGEFYLPSNTTMLGCGFVVCIFFLFFNSDRRHFTFCIFLMKMTSAWHLKIFHGINSTWTKSTP